MKITEERLKEIILEEIESLKENEMEKFGTKNVSSSERSKGLRQGATDVTQASGIDAKEYGMITQIEKVLSELATVTDIKTGTIQSVLQLTYKRLVHILRKIKQEKDK